MRMAARLLRMNLVYTYLKAWNFHGSCGAVKAGVFRTLMSAMFCQQQAIHGSSQRTSVEYLCRETMLFILICFMNKGQARQSGSMLLSGSVVSDAGPSQPLMNRHHHTLSPGQFKRQILKQEKKKIDLLQTHWGEGKRFSASCVIIGILSYSPNIST